MIEKNRDERRILQSKKKIRDSNGIDFVNLIVNIVEDCLKIVD